MQHEKFSIPNPYHAQNDERSVMKLFVEDTQVNRETNRRPPSNCYIAKTNTHLLLSRVTSIYIGRFSFHFYYTA